MKKMAQYAIKFNQCFWINVIIALIHINHIGSESNILNGQHLQIATLDVRPYMSIDLDTNGNIYHADGIVYQIINWLSIRSNFTYKLVLSSDGTFGALVNNTWNGMIGMAVEDQVQLIAAPLLRSFERVRVLDFTVPFYYEPICCLIPAPEAEGNALVPIVKPFQYQVWILIIFSIFGIAFVTSFTVKLAAARLISKIKRNEPSHQNQFKEIPLAEQLVFAFEVIFFNSKNNTNNSYNSVLIIGAVWYLSCIVLVYLYTAILISCITIPKLRPIVDSVEDLANSNRLEVVTIKNSIFESTLLKSTVGPLKILGDHLRQNPENSLSGDYYSLDKLLERATLGRYAIVMAKSQAESVMELDWKQENRCRLSIMREQILFSSSCFALPKGSPFTQLITQGFIVMHDTGLMQYWKNRSPLAASQCDPNNKQMLTKQKENKKPLSLKNLSGALVILQIGLSVSLIAFIVEIVVGNCHKMKF